MLSTACVSGARFVGAHQAAKVQAKTLERYRQALLPFTTWAVEQQFDFVSAEEWDDLLVEYVHTHVAVTRAKFS